MSAENIQLPGKKDQTELKSIFGKWIRIILILACIAFAVYLVELAFEGFYTRYLADDFCYGVPATQMGVFRGLADVYMRWSGRFAAIFFIFLGSIPGTWASTIVPAILIIGLTGSLYLLFKNIFQFWRSSHVRIKSILMAISALTIYSLITPNRYQVLDWMNGSITYTGPMILMILLFAWFLHTVRVKSSHMNWLSGIGIFLFSAITAGFSETTSAELVAAIALCILVSLLVISRADKWRVIQWQLVALAGGITGFVIDAVAPGNATRVGLINVGAPSLATLLFTSFKFSADYFINTIKGFIVPAVVLFVLVFMVVFIGEPQQDKDPGKKTWFKKLLPFLLILVVAYILTAAICAPAVYFQGAFPENRAMSAGAMVFILTIALLAAFAGRLASRIVFKSLNIRTFLTIGSMAVILLAGVYAIRAVVLHVPAVKATIQYSQIWDARNNLIRQQIKLGQKDVVVTTITSQHGLSELSPDPNFWVNICAAKYYLLNSIRAQ